MPQRDHKPASVTMWLNVRNGAIPASITNAL